MTLVKFRRPFDNGHTNNQVMYNSPFTGLMENFFGSDFFTKEYASFVPAVNVSEETDKFSVELSAPGFEKTDFKIEVDKGILTVSGEHKTETKEEGGKKETKYTRKEFSYGSFQRRFTLPEDVNAEAIDAKYESGILKLVLPKKEKAKDNGARAISIA